MILCQSNTKYFGGSIWQWMCVYCMYGCVVRWFVRSFVHTIVYLFLVKNSKEKKKFSFHVFIVAGLCIKSQEIFLFILLKNKFCFLFFALLFNHLRRLSNTIFFWRHTTTLMKTAKVYAPITFVDSRILYRI